MKMYKIFLGLGSELVISTFMPLAKAKWHGQAKSQGGEEMHSTRGNAMNLGKVKIWDQQFTYRLRYLTLWELMKASEDRCGECQGSSPGLWSQR